MHTAVAVTSRPIGRSRIRLGRVAVLRGGFLAVLALALVASADPPPSAIALGDSITYGYPDPATGWTARLGLENAGVPGNRTDQMLRRLAAVLSEGPHVVLVMGGTNDLLQHVAVPTIVANLRAIVDEIEGRHAIAVLLTIAPPANQSWVSRVDALNDAIRALAESSRVRLIDVHAVLSGPDGTFARGYSVDGVHPSAAGYKAMAGLIRATIEPGLAAGG